MGFDGDDPQTVAHQWGRQRTAARTDVDDSRSSRDRSFRDERFSEWSRELVPAPSARPGHASGPS